MIPMQYSLGKYVATGVRRLWRNALTARYRPQSGWSPAPSLVVLRPTLRCNLSCQICYDRGEHIIRESWPAQRDDEGSELNEQQWIDLITDLAAFKPTFYITGGEPLLATTLMPILRTIKQRGCYVSLNTNGVLLESRAEELLEIGVDKIIVSLDGPPETHDAVRGQSFDALAKGIRKVQSLIEARGLKRPVLRLQCVISHLNLHCLEETVEEARKLGCGEIRFQHPIFAFNKEECCASPGLKSVLTRFDASRPHKAWVGVSGKDVLSQMKRLTAGTYRGTRVAFEPDVAMEDIIGYYDDASHPFPDLCLSPWRRMDVSPAGEMGACQGLYLGRFPETRPSECWNGTAFRSLRRQMIEGHLFGVCNRCCHREYRAPRTLGLEIS